MNPRSSSVAPRPAVHLHIERLVLDGLSLKAGQAAVLQAALEAELSRLAGERGLSEAWQHDGAVASVSAPSFCVPTGASPAATGRQVARALFESLRPASAVPFTASGLAPQQGSAMSSKIQTPSNPVPIP